MPLYVIETEDETDEVLTMREFKENSRFWSSCVFRGLLFIAFVFFLIYLFY
jgi:hypothetical protein